MGRNWKLFDDNYKDYKFKVNKNTEPDMIKFLDNLNNKQGFLKNLVRNSMQEILT